MKRLVIDLFLTLIVCFAFVLSANVHALTFRGWEIEDGGGQYIASDGTIYLSGLNGTFVVLYQEIAPQDDFDFSLQVNASC